MHSAETKLQCFIYIHILFQLCGQLRMMKLNELFLKAPSTLATIAATTVASVDRA